MGIQITWKAMMAPTLDELIEALADIDSDDIDAKHAAYRRMLTLYPDAGEEIGQRLKARADQARERAGEAEIGEAAEGIIDDMVNRGELIRLGGNMITDGKNFFARCGWKPASCKLPMKIGDRRRPRRIATAGYSAKGLFIHCVPGRGWNVSHAATGYRIKGILGINETAAQAALDLGEAIAGLADWAGIQSLEDWERASTPELIEAVNQACDAAFAPYVLRH